MRTRGIHLQLLVGWAIPAVLALVILSSGCAQKGSPEGGPPDTTPPQIMTTVPAGGAVSVSPTTSFEIEFSERIDKAKFAANLFVSPRRAGDPETQWSGNAVRITWTDSLRRDVTYRVTVGSRVTDTHNNPLANPYTFAFSTGEKIDSGRVRGRVWQDMTPATAYDVLAYMLTGAAWDPSAPDYQTQTNDSGRFDLPYLPDAVFRIVAVQDKNRDGKPSPGEFVAVAPNDVQSTQDGGRSIELYAAMYDTLPFIVSGSSVSNDGSLLLGMSRAIDTARWTPHGFVLSDSTSGDLISGTVLNPVPPRFVIVPVVPGDVPPGRTVRVVYAPPAEGAGEFIFDEWGYALSPCTSYVTYPEIVDSTGPRILWTRFPSVVDAASPTAPIEWGFSEPVTFTDTTTVVAVYDSNGQAINGAVRFHDSRHVLFTPDAVWPETTMIVVSLDSAVFRDRQGNPPPSQRFTWTFQPLTTAGMGDVALQVRTLDSATAAAPTVITARSVRAPMRRRWRMGDGESIMLTLPSGEWLLGAYKDLDGDGFFTPGRIAPRYRPAEPRTTLLDTVTVRARFTVEDIILEL